MIPTRRRFLGQSVAVAGGVAVGPGVGGRAAAAQERIDPAALDALRGRLQGRLVVPGDETFDRDRRVFYTNPRTETKPAAIVQCGHADDVPRALEFARRQGLELAVRSGGHSHLAWGSSGGLVVDLAALRRIAVDPERRTVTVDGGVLGGEVAVAVGKHGLAPVLGQCPGVGAAGVTFGGGLGWLSGLFGACCDNLLSASIVTADGRTVEASTSRDPDLLWGRQGAGANFGVATSFTARLHPLGPVVGGDIHYDPRDARDVLRGFRDVMHAAPDALQATLNLTRGDRGLFISLCHAGDEADAERLLETLRTIARPTKEAVRRQDYATIVSPGSRPGSTPTTSSTATPTSPPRGADGGERHAEAGACRMTVGVAHAPGAGVCRQAQPGWRSASGIRVSAGLEPRSERPATGHGRPRPTPTDSRAPGPTARYFPTR